MTAHPIAAVVLAAGKGTRMKSSLPKVMHPLAGRPMILHLLQTLDDEAISPVIVVAGPEMDHLESILGSQKVVVQKERKGTGHAVDQTRDQLCNYKGDILVCYGDTPLISSKTFSRMREVMSKSSKTKLVVLGFKPDDPAEYGRLIVSEGGLESIVEFKDASENQLAHRYCNAGALLADASVLFEALSEIEPNNSASEYYLTDVVKHVRRQGHVCEIVSADENEVIGINSRHELAKAETILQNTYRAKAMANGATLLDPSTVYFSFDTVLGSDVEVGPFTVFGPGVTVGRNVNIKGFCHIEGTNISDNASVGPFARLRAGTDIGYQARVGNFVEIKNSALDEDSKANHLSYIGDTTVGRRANIGAGTITANYDGFSKSHTDIGDDVSIGSNSVLVAPVSLGDGAITGAGSVIRKDVPADALALSRAPQKTIKGRAVTYRKARGAETKKS